MAALKTLAVFAGFAALVVAFWPKAVEVPHSVAQASGASPTESIQVTSDVASAEAAARVELPDDDPRELEPMLLRGRCVDQRGAPIVGVTGRITGKPTTKVRMAAWCARHPEPGPLDERFTTDVDGVFELRFWPPPPFQFSFAVEKLCHTSASRHWAELAPGSTKDVGDLVMASGTLLRGRVGDVEGIAAAHASLGFRRVGGAVGTDGAASVDSFIAAHDGVFVGRMPLAAGDYTVAVAHREVVRPARVTVSGMPVEQVVDVVLAPVDPTATLRGVVVDEAGTPVPSVMVTPVPTPKGGFLAVGTDLEGRFEIRRWMPDAPDEIALYLEHRDFDPPLALQTFAWGRGDLRFVLRRSLEVEVAVVPRGPPVGDFSVRLLSAGSASSGEVRARGRGSEAPVVVTRVQRGEYFVFVTPAGEALASSGLVPVAVTGPGRARVTVSLDPIAKRTLRVQRTDGAPLVGASVQLVDPGGHAGRLRVFAVDEASLSSPHGSALRIQRAKTDARGEVVLCGPAGRALALWLPGPKHAPTWVGDVRLDVSAPMVVTVSSGGQVIGSIGPLELLGEWRFDAGLPFVGPIPGGQIFSAPAVSLLRDGNGTPEEHPARPVPLDEFGGFTIDDVPAGTWRILVVRTRGRGGVGSREAFDADTVDVRAGAATRVDADLSRFMPGDLEGLVLRNGIPLAETEVRLSVEGRGVGFETARTDAQGRFRARLRPGEYGLAVVSAEGNVSPATPRVLVRSDQRANCTFHVSDR